MATIYKLPHRVVVRLGRGSTDSSLALSTLSKLVSQVQVSKDLVHWWANPDYTGHHWIFEPATPLPFTDNQGKSIDRLFRLQWF